MRTLRVYSLNNFTIYHTVIAIVIMLYTTSLVPNRLISEVCIFWSPSSNSSFPISASGNHKSDLFFNEVFFFSKDSTYKWDHTVFVFLWKYFIF